MQTTTIKVMSYLEWKWKRRGARESDRGHAFRERSAAGAQGTKYVENILEQK